MHLAVDHGAGLVGRAILTPRHVSDPLPFLDLVQDDERAVYADEGYDGSVAVKWVLREEHGGTARRVLATIARAAPALGGSWQHVVEAAAPSGILCRGSAAYAR
jgi:hypothetical protein